jgi:PASTA domain-containing protein
MLAVDPEVHPGLSALLLHTPPLLAGESYLAPFEREVARCPCWSVANDAPCPETAEATLGHRDQTSPVRAADPEAPGPHGLSVIFHYSVKVRRMAVSVLALACAALTACGGEPVDDARGMSAVEQAGSMPDVRGLSQQAATESVLAYTSPHIEVRTEAAPSVPRGLVAYQEPRPGTGLTADSTVTLVVSNGDKTGPLVVSSQVDYMVTIVSDAGDVLGELAAGATMTLDRVTACAARFLTAQGPASEAGFMRSAPCRQTEWIISNP